MKRQASIHISKGALYKVLRKVLEDDYTKEQVKVLCKAILQEGVKYAIPNRSLNVSNQKLVKSTKGIRETETEDTKLFSHLLTLCRKQLKHRGIIQSSPGTRDWTIIQGTVSFVNTFCKEFKLTKKEGYLAYIKIGLKKMNTFYISNFQSLYDQIVSEYAAVEELQDDMTPLRTEKAHSIYSKHCGQLAIIRNYSKDPSSMVCFKRVADKAAELKISIEHYIAAQFEGLKWANTIPDPKQLISEAAISRLQKYIVKAGLKEEMNQKSTDDVAEKIKKQWSKLS